MQWILKACDLNKDVEIQDNCQMTLPAIQLKYAGRIFRLYVKSPHDKAVYRSEESITLNCVLLYFSYLCFDLWISRLTRSLLSVVFTDIGDIIAYKHGLHFCEEVYPYRNQDKV
jgi:hypothetical protein